MYENMTKDSHIKLTHFCYVHRHTRPIKALVYGIQGFLNATVSTYWAAVELFKNVLGTFFVLTTFAKVPSFLM